MKFKGEERRQKVRLHKKIDAKLIFFSDLIIPDTPQERQGIIHNFSAGGVYAEAGKSSDIECEALLRGIVKVGVRMRFPSQEKEVTALAKAVWAKRSTQDEQNLLIGLKFVDVTHWAEDFLEQQIINAYSMGSDLEE